MGWLLDRLIGSEESAMDFLRIKGVFNIMGSDEMFVVQCVHMLRNQNFTKPWGKQKRENRIIFIGRGMQGRRQELTDGIMACVNKAPPRFKIGDWVMAKTGEHNYTPGTVVRL